MYALRVGPFERYRRAWWQLRGEQPVCTTVERRDYRRGTYCWNGGHCFRITHSVAAPDGRHYEVWGREVRRCAGR